MNYFVEQFVPDCRFCLRNYKRHEEIIISLFLVMEESLRLLESLVPKKKRKRKAIENKRNEYGQRVLRNIRTEKSHSMLYINIGINLFKF